MSCCGDHPLMGCPAAVAEGLGSRCWGHRPSREVKQGSGGSDSGSFPCCLNTCVFSSAAQRRKVKGWGLKGDGRTSVAETQSGRARVSGGGGRPALWTSWLRGDGEGFSRANEDPWISHWRPLGWHRAWPCWLVPTCHRWSEHAEQRGKHFCMLLLL